MAKTLIQQAMAEIYEVLERYNMAGFVVIHTPGECKFLLQLDPAYSCVKIEQSGRISFKADLQRDFGGNRAAMEERVLQTAEMLTSIVTTSAIQILTVGGLQKNVMKLLQQDPEEPEPEAQ